MDPDKAILVGKVLAVAAAASFILSFLFAEFHYQNDPEAVRKLILQPRVAALKKSMRTHQPMDLAAIPAMDLTNEEIHSEYVTSTCIFWTPILTLVFAAPVYWLIKPRPRDDDDLDEELKKSPS